MPTARIASRAPFGPGGQDHVEQPDLTLPPGPVHRFRQRHQAGVAHDLEPAKICSGRVIANIRGDPEHAARLPVRAAQQRIVPQAQSIETPKAHVPGIGPLFASERGRGTQAPADRPEHERDTQPGYRRRVADRNRNGLMREVKTLAAGESGTDPAPGPGVENHISGLEHAVQAFGPAYTRRFSPFDDTNGRKLRQYAAWRPFCDKSVRSRHGGQRDSGSPIDTRQRLHPRLGRHRWAQ